MHRRCLSVVTDFSIPCLKFIYPETIRMRAIWRNIAAVLAGILFGGLVNMAIIIAGPLVIPVPEGVDMSDMEKFSENLMRLKPVNFLAPWLAHALGTLAGAFVAAIIAASHPRVWALVVSLFFFLGGIWMVTSYGGPAWFAVVDLVGAYLPAGLLGGKLGAVASRQISRAES